MNNEVESRGDQINSVVAGFECVVDSPECSEMSFCLLACRMARGMVLENDRKVIKCWHRDACSCNARIERCL